MINTFDLYYKINKDIINNYNINNKRNYYKLQNLKYLKNNNKEIINYINNIINNNDIFKIYKLPNDKFYYYTFGIYLCETENDLKEEKGIFYFNKAKSIKYFHSKKHSKKLEEEELKREMSEFMICFNKKKYEGEFKNGIIEGKGILYYIDGSRYEGNIKKSFREGNGIMYNNKGLKEYEGYWKNDEKEGKGIEYFNNINRYEGEFKNGERVGKGKLFIDDDCVFEVENKNGGTEGKGIFYNKGNKEMELCYYIKNGVFEGKGIKYLNNSIRYECDIKNFMKEKGNYILMMIVCLTVIR